ncbi:hypothetical protein DH2020_041597 [Rehmannia glutinosa]|uniref:Uncharacterized protein n=1 Tax=Rehmannia glutinosa TaxID=99300 RepID=A0ABR0UQQ4_REHGL
MISNADEDHDPVVIFGDSLFPNQAYSLTGWGDEEENFKVAANSSSANHGENWGNSFDNGAAIGWPDYSNNVGYMTWGDGWNNDWNWNYTNNNNNTIYQVGPGLEHKIAGGEKGPCNDRIFASGQQPDKRRTERAFHTLVGNMIGKFLDVDNDSSGSVFGKFLRIRCEIDISKPLRRVV